MRSAEFGLRPIDSIAAAVARPWPSAAPKAARPSPSPAASAIRPLYHIPPPPSAPASAASVGLAARASHDTATANPPRRLICFLSGPRSLPLLYPLRSRWDGAPVLV